jgi:hypothetical protein
MGFKSFDFFQKITLDNISQPTLVGSLLSLSAITIMITLLIRELSNFYTPHIKTDTVVIQDDKQSEQIPVHLNIKFNHVPCSLLSLDQEDSLRNHRFDISDTIKKTILPKSGKPQPYDKSAYANIENTYTAIENDDGCSLTGFFKVSKVPGDFHISFHNYGPQWKSVVYNKPELSKKVKMTHHIKTMDFGAMERFKLFRYGIDPRSFFRTDLPDFSEFKENRDYIYYVKLIPYRFVDENRNRVDYSYQYAVSYKDKPQENEQPLVLVKYEFSAVTMQVTIQGRDYFHFLTHVCAIVGGIFVVFSILNRFLVSFFDFSGGSNKK